MSQIQIQTPKPTHDFTDFLFGKWSEHVRRLEERAYRFFQERGENHGGDVDDWLRAEREINAGTTFEAVVAENTIHIAIQTPGFTAEQLKVNIVPGLILIEGEREEETGDAATQQGFLHRFELPADANTDAASATYQGDELRVTIPRESKEAPAGDTLTEAAGA